MLLRGLTTALVVLATPQAAHSFKLSMIGATRRAALMGRGMSSLLMLARPSVRTQATAQAAATFTEQAGVCQVKPPCARVIPVPVLSDNYAYIITDPATGATACVDPAEPEKLLAVAQREGLKIGTLLCTHKHWDHAGGNIEMARQIPGLDVVTTAYEDIPAATARLEDNDVFSLGSLDVYALYTPCHTRGHVLFYVVPKSEAERKRTAPLLFSGDTLFVGGCGRFFEGDGRQMHEALMTKVAKLPKETLVYCGHEYTKSNLAFAAWVEPSNKVLADKVAWVERTLSSGGYTVPTTIEEELMTNPFMRVHEPTVAKAALGGNGSNVDPVAVMSKLRELKNNFKG